MVREISRDRALREKVIPLAFHIDYWNHLGWRDPLSSPDWTRRQTHYVDALSLNSAYTPQMVVDGYRQFVGSDRRSLETAVMHESRQPPFGTVSAHLMREGSTLQARIDANITSPVVELVMAVFEDGIPTKIASGENGGSATVDDAVVRRLIRIDTLARGSVTKSIDIAIDPKWNQWNLGIAVFLQDPRTRMIRGAAVARVEP